MHILCFIIMLSEILSENEKHSANECTLIKSWRYNKVNLASLAFYATLAEIQRNVKQIEQVYLAQTPVYTSAKFPEFNPVDACRGFPTELTPQGRLAMLYRQNFLRVWIAWFIMWLSLLTKRKLRNIGEVNDLAFPLQLPYKREAADILHIMCWPRFSVSCLSKYHRSSAKDENQPDLLCSSHNCQTSLC